MPVPEERLHNPVRLNRWFAVSSILMTGSIFWLIVVDYDRPWRSHQDDYFVAKAAIAHLDYLDTQREDRKKEVAEARRRLEDARQLFEATLVSEQESLLKEHERVTLEFQRAEAPWSMSRQVLDVTKDTYEKRRELYGENHPLTVEARRKFRDEEAALDELRQTKEQWEDQKKDIERRLRDLEAPLRRAEKELADLEQVATDALQRDQQFRGVLSDEGLLAGIPVIKMLINAPLLDFTAPKNTPGRHQINQLVLPHVRQRLNYLETYTTDRCTTCHVSIDDPDFSQERLARRLESSLPAISEARQRDGFEPVAPPAPPTLRHRGDAPLPEGRVTEFWKELTREQQNAYFDGLLAIVNRYLTDSGRKPLELKQPILAHPDLDLYVSVNSPHPMASMGCTVCHEGNPQETDFVQAAHTPPTHEIEEEWKEKYYIHMLGVPNVTFDTVSHFWERPIRLPRHTEAGCVKCHEEITDIARFEGERRGERINLGRHLFTQVGCVNCHNDNSLPDYPKVGPDLSHVAAKLRPDFTQPWIYFPQRFRPSTRMPHFFMQENNRPESANQFDPDPVLRTETEVAAITRYLYTVSQPWEPIEKPAGLGGDVERGRVLFTQVGCQGCHTNLAEHGETWITTDLVHREGLDEETALYRYKGMTLEQRNRYAQEHFNTEDDTFLRPETVRFDPDEYTVPTIARFAPELSAVGSKLNPEWLYSWLLEPTHYSPTTKMPSLRLTPAEAADLTAYLMSLKHPTFVPGEFEMDASRREMADNLLFDRLSAQRSERRSRAILRDDGEELTEMLIALLAGPLKSRDRASDLVNGLTLEDKKMVYLGSRMISHYGCYACHNIVGFEETTPPGTDLSGWAEKPISQLDFAFYDSAFAKMRKEKKDEFGYLYPPDARELNYWSPTADYLEEQITKTHGAFAKHKMLNPRLWDRNKLKRPYDKLLMPNYYFTEEEAEALTTYLLSRVPPRVDDVLKVDYVTEPKGPIARGRALTRELNCVGCHEIEDNVPLIQQYFRRQFGGQTLFDVTNAPPTLRGEGAKIQHNWLHRFLNQVEPLRPWLAVRMPSFNLTSEQSTTLVEYFAALSQDDSRKLARHLASVHEYQGSAARSGGGDGSDWYQQPELERQAADLRRYSLETGLLRTVDLDPLATPADRFHENHAELLRRVQFMKELYDVSYPFVEPPAPLSNPERFERGMNFLKDMGCLQCHVLGDMLPGPATSTDEFVQVYRLDGVRGEDEAAVAILNGVAYPVGAIIDGHTIISATNIYHLTGDVETRAVVEGPGPEGSVERVLLQAASAPNLSLTYERLRRDWVFAWMLEPQWIQPGTKMPQNFTGGQSPFHGSDQYPGTSQDHINLLVDVLYDAGYKRVRAPLPKIKAMDTSQEFEEFDEEFFDD